MEFLIRKNAKTYKEAKKFLKNKGIKTQRQYNNWVKGKAVKYGIPCGPRKFYKNDWIGWGDFLGTDRIALINKEFYTYEECVVFVRKHNIKSKREYQRFYKNHNMTPSNPYKEYIKEWKGWYDFLGTTAPNFLSFDDARIYVHELKLNSVKEWIYWYKMNRPIFLPSHPNGVYIEWISWMDWLNSKFNHSQSAGSKIVEDILNKKNIKYIKEKKFDECKNINKLSFDFYLCDYNTCLEYNGQQHYKSVSIFGGEKRLKYQKNNDNIKIEFCLNNNIKLIVISYLEIDNIYNILNNHLINLVKNNIEYGSI